jgi:hypothetical protein
MLPKDGKGDEGNTVILYYARRAVTMKRIDYSVLRIP